MATKFQILIIQMDSDEQYTTPQQSARTECHQIISTTRKTHFTYKMKEREKETEINMTKTGENLIYLLSFL